ncbi:hypothetical protein GGR57DRAFT_492808 [Xylariaceae sp. FL1272]|nr:hypothetical protein GGR57DRAFT_492808 [Xylariaceae sp. FL1272]
MPLVLEDIDPEKDFPSIARCMFESYEDPPQPCIQLWFPIHGNDDDSRERAIEDAAKQLKQSNANDPTSYWQKIVDDESGRIAGGALWSIFEQNPFTNYEPRQAPWFPDDGSRAYAETALRIHVTPRLLCSQRPHIYLFIIFTHPDYRRRGVGRQFMEWGAKKADEMDLDTFLDASEMGKPLYEATGFVSVMDNPIYPQKEESDEQWKALQQRVGYFSLCLMWRPIGGNYEMGKTIKPWE